MIRLLLALSLMGTGSLLCTIYTTRNRQTRLLAFGMLLVCVIIATYGGGM